MKLSGTITKVSGPLVVATGLAEANVADVVRVGEQRLIGEILTMTGDTASIQVYEETSGLGPGAEGRVTTGSPAVRGAGPRPAGEYLRRHPAPAARGHPGDAAPAPTCTRGVEVPALDRETTSGTLTPAVQPGTKPSPAATSSAPSRRPPAILHKIMVPPQDEGHHQESIQSGGDFTVDRDRRRAAPTPGRRRPGPAAHDPDAGPSVSRRPYAHKYPPDQPPAVAASASSTRFFPDRQGRHRRRPRPLRQRARPSMQHAARQVVRRGSSSSTSAAASAATR